MQNKSPNLICTHLLKVLIGVDLLSVEYLILYYYFTDEHRGIYVRCIITDHNILHKQFNLIYKLRGQRWVQTWEKWLTWQHILF